VNRVIDLPMSKLIVLAVLSTGMAILFFFLGGSLAEVGNESGTFLGFTFKATGAIGGFFLILWSLFSVLRKLEAQLPINVELKVRGKNRTFKDNETYTAIATIFRSQSRTEEEVNVSPQPSREPNELSLTLDGVYPEDRIRAVIMNDKGASWQVKQFQVNEPMWEAERIGTSRERTSAVGRKLPMKPTVEAGESSMADRSPTPGTMGQRISPKHAMPTRKGAKRGGIK
jgi:hypothetical protein